MPDAQAGEQDPEGLDLLVAAGQRRRARAGARRIWVADRVDRRSIPTYTEFCLIP
jgi:hypothetical protein